MIFNNLLASVITYRNPTSSPPLLTSPFFYALKIWYGTKQSNFNKLQTVQNKKF